MFKEEKGKSEVTICLRSSSNQYIPMSRKSSTPFNGELTDEQKDCWGGKEGPVLELGTPASCLDTTGWLCNRLNNILLGEQLSKTNFKTIQRSLKALFRPLHIHDAILIVSVSASIYVKVTRCRPTQIFVSQHPVGVHPVLRNVNLLGAVFSTFWNVPIS